MGLETEERQKVPSEFSVKECYKRMYNWLKKSGLDYVKEITDRNSAFIFCTELLNLLPKPEEASSADMDFLFGSVIAGPIEWFYHARDDKGIKIAAYSHFALSKKYSEGFGDDKMRKSMKTSFLWEAKDKIWKEARAEEEEIKPDRLRIQIGGYGLSGPSCSVNWRQGLLKYSSKKNGYAFSPSVKRWKDFWKELDRIGVWNWKREYRPEFRRRGRKKWRIDIKWKSKEIKAEGKDAYPPNASYEMSNEFKKFYEAVLNLVQWGE